jgi:hypothetical protein
VPAVNLADGKPLLGAYSCTNARAYRSCRTLLVSAALLARPYTLLTLPEPSFTVREVFFSFGPPPTMSPSDAAWQQLISTLHGSGRKAALAITGGGSGAVGELLRVPGGSRLLIEAQVPYDAGRSRRFSALHRHSRAVRTPRSRWHNAHGHAQPG